MAVAQTSLGHSYCQPKAPPVTNQTHDIFKSGHVRRKTQQEAQTQSKLCSAPAKVKAHGIKHMVPEDLHKLLLQRGKVRPPPVRPPQARPLPLPQKPQRGWCSPPRMCMLCVPSSMSPTGYTTCWVLPGCWCWTFSTPWIGSSSRLAPPHRYMHVSQAYIRCKPVSRYNCTRV